MRVIAEQIENREGVEFVLHVPTTSTLEMGSSPVSTTPNEKGKYIENKFDEHTLSHCCAKKELCLTVTLK